jgi:hypothetical protein
MKTVIWNRRLIDGSIQEVSFTALFSEDHQSVDTYLEEMARRAGVIRSKATFTEEMSRIELAYEIDLIFAKDRDDIIKASEYYTAKAMILVVRYALSDERDSQEVAQETFKHFLAKVKFNPSSDVEMAA